MPLKINLLIISFLLTAQSIYADEDCTVNVTFIQFANNNNLYASQNPMNELSQFAEKNNISKECAYKMAMNYIPTLAKEWVAKAHYQGCFSDPIGSDCPIETQKEIFGNITLLDQWALYYKNEKNKSAPTTVVCKIKNPLGEVPKLTTFVADILSIMNKEDRLKFKQDLDDQKKCNEPSIVTADDSSQMQYFKDLLAKGEAAPLDDFLKYWYPEKAKEIKKDPYFFDCQSSPWGYLDKAETVDGEVFLSKECQPDALYSWGPEVKLLNMKKTMQDGSNWTRSPNPNPEKNAALFMSMSPVSTFGYGETVVRVKIKKDTPYAFGETFNANKEDGVRVRQGVFQDFTTRDSSSIESWSYGTPEIYDEIVMDIIRFKSLKRAQKYFHNDKEYDEESPGGIHELFNNIDGFEFSEKILKQRLLHLIKMIVNGEGRIMYQNGTCRNRDNHYMTNKPTYFNPY